MNNSFIGKKTKRKKGAKNKSGTLETLMQHTKGLPPSCNWSNSFSSIRQGFNLIYISNAYIIVINLTLKSFEQTLSSNRITGSDKPSLLISFSPSSFIAITEQGALILFTQKTRPNGELLFLEDLSSQTNSINMQFARTVRYVEERKCLFLTSKSSLACFKVINADGLQLKNEYCIPMESEVTDMILINGELCLACMSGAIVLFEFINGGQSIRKKKTIESSKHIPIYSIDYCNESQLLASIDKNGTLTLYDSISYQIKLSRQNQFNDKTINEHYLYFTLKFFSNNKIAVSSNQGRIFLFHFEENKFQEISENPHTQSIFNIILFKEENYVAFVSSDHFISFFTLDDMNFDFTLRTIPSKPSHLIADHTQSKVYFTTFNEALEMYSYCHSKKQNQLLSIQRTIPVMSNITMMKQIGEMLGLLLERELILYDYPEGAIKQRIELNEEVVGFDYLESNDQGVILIGFQNYTVQLIKYPSEQSLKANTVLLKDREKEENTVVKSFFCSFQRSNAHWVYGSYESDKRLHVYLFNEIISAELYSIPFDSFIFAIQVKDSSIQLHIYKDKGLTFIHIPISTEIHLLQYENYHSYTQSFESLQIIKQHIPSIVYCVLYPNLFPQGQTSLLANNNTLITTQANGVILVYASSFKENAHTLLLMNQIKAHYSKITDIAFISSKEIVSTSLDQSLKLWSTEDCIQLNIKCNSTMNSKGEEFICEINYFSKLQDEYFYQQSSSSGRQFIKDFTAFYSSLSESSFSFDDAVPNNELLLFSYFKKPELNYITVVYLLKYEKEQRSRSSITLTKKYYSILKHIDALYEMIKGHLPLPVKVLYEEAGDKDINEEEQEDIEKDWIDSFEEKNRESIVNALIEKNCFVDALLVNKVLDMGVDQFILSLNTIKTKIFSKQMFQAIKIEKVIQSLKQYHKGK